MMKFPGIPYAAFFLVVALFLYPQKASSQHFNSRVEASLNVNNAKNDILDVVGTAKNLTEGNYSLHYELSVITSDQSQNSSKSSQSGRFTLEPFETKTLSKTSVSINPHSRTILLLLIYDQDDKVIGTARKVYNEAKESEPELSYKKPNEGIQLTGMVTEKTKTKPGKDFYDYFYQKYSLSPNKLNKIIEVEEQISFGRTTRIAVKVQDQVVYQFFVRPKLDYLEDQADKALRQVNRYFEYLKNRSETTTQY
ncbi:MAG: CsgE family curli-type amyloid fiber assembly protein [Salegentibacter sp.]